MTIQEKLAAIRTLRSELNSLKAQYQAITQTLMSLQGQLQKKQMEIETALEDLAS